MVFLNTVLRVFTPQLWLKAPTRQHFWSVSLSRALETAGHGVKYFYHICCFLKYLPLRNNKENYLYYNNNNRNYLDPVQV